MNTVLDILQKYTPYARQSGPEHAQAICPFHRHEDGSYESHPSFSMNTTTGLWICFSCKERGNLVTFLKSVGVSQVIIKGHFQVLLDELSKNAPTPKNPLKPGVITSNPIPEGMLGIFEKCPLPLIQEGFTEETLRKFDIGFDDVHMRITYPLRDVHGNLVGISGRAVLEEDYPRYKIYEQEYLKFGLPARNTDKSQILWNGHNVYPAALMNGVEYIVVVEGFKACMWLGQAGVKDVVALIGSFISEDQRWLLEHMGVPVYLMMDNDAAGKKGRSYVAPLLAQSLPVKIVEYEGDQPSDITPESVHQALKCAKDYYLWAIQSGERSWEHSARTKAI